MINHAEATRVNITLLSTFDRVELRIQDDGRGFDPQLVPAGHMGINIMAERAHTIGGDLHIHSEPGAGTEIRAAWPGPADKDKP